MNKFKGILMCTDLDGTLLKNDHTISEENVEAIEYFESRGGIFTFITGRMPFFAREIYDMIKANGPVGCVNGCGIYDYKKGEYMWTQGLESDVIELVEYADKKVPGLGIQLNCFDRTYFCKENSEMARFRKSTGLPNLTAGYHEVSEPLAKIVFGDENSENIKMLRKVLDEHPRADEFFFVQSERTLYEILPKGINKGTVLLKMAELLGIDKTKTVALGDYNNDIEMLKVAGFGVAVKNATPEAKAAADYITVSNEEHAVAKIISEIDTGKIIL